MPNAKKIKSRMVELGITIRSTANEMNMSPYTLGKKISGKAPMTIQEARSLQRILQFPDNEITVYFF